MPKVRFDMVSESATTTGTGNFTLAGAKNPGRTFATAGVATSDTFKYRISHDVNNEWEVGTGTLLTSTTFSRSAISSSNANALVSFSAGDKTVDLVVDRLDLDQMESGVFALTSNAAATNATTNLSVCSSTIPANSLRVGSVYRMRGYFVFVHTAASTPTITIEVLINAAVVETLIVTPIATAATYRGRIEALMTCRTTGSGGTVMVTIESISTAGSNASNQMAGTTGTATDAINTTVSRSLELRMRMTTAVASNTLTVIQGLMEKVN